ncbi:hypothetical protein ACIBCD_03790 [Nocardia brasiliensis]|uniref:hypothetical protein n=1 Tax=Nocardia brasiliensis TaxID=37326 RepID=UPI0037BDE57A
MGTVPIQRSDALAEGFSDNELRRLTTRCGWHRIRPGSYLPPHVYATLDRQQRYSAFVHAAAAHLSAPAVLSHQSSAVVQDLPLWGLALDRVHVTRHRAGGGRRRKHLHVHCAPFEEADVVSIGALRAFTPARTVADIARTAAFQAVVAVGDAAVRRFQLSHETLCQALSYAEGRPGFRAAERAIGLFDGRSESVGESRSRVVLADLDLPTPELQSTILDTSGRFVARVDFCFEQLGVIGEFDGKLKYDGSLTAPATTVYEEKLREDNLRDLGWEVVRWTWPDLDTTANLSDRFRRAAARAAHRPRPTGRVVRMPRTF